MPGRIPHMAATTWNLPEPKQPPAQVLGLSCEAQVGTEGKGRGGGRGWVMALVILTLEPDAGGRFSSGYQG